MLARPVFALLSLALSPVLGVNIRQHAYTPAVVTPDASTVWHVGAVESVTWDASKVPPGPDNIPWVQLYNTSSFGNALWVSTLAENFDGHAGSVSFTVPQVDPGMYFVMLGAWGQSSYRFAIEA